MTMTSVASRRASRPLEIGDDYVLGRFGDDLDVEHVQVWELVKPAD